MIVFKIERVLACLFGLMLTAHAAIVSNFDKSLFEKVDKISSEKNEEKMDGDKSEGPPECNHRC